jgi:SHS2 domain-containing protein
MVSLKANYTPLDGRFNMTLGYTDRVTSSGFVELDHTADWAIRVHGVDLPDLFQQAAAGLLSLADPIPVPDRPSTHLRLRLASADRETLLVRWLEELHYLLETKRQIPRSIQLRISPGLDLVAELEVEAAASPGRAIKAVTFNNLAISESMDGLAATVVFDV